MNALLIIDMQNDFASPGGALPSEGAREIVPVVLEAARRAREAGIAVIHVIQEHRADGTDFGRELDRSKPHCIEGTWGARIIDEIPVEPGDTVLVKKRFSGFFATELDLLLRDRGIDRLILTGTATDGCVRATAVDAHQLGYYFNVVRGAVAGAFAGSHQAALDYLVRLQKDVLMDVEDIG